MNLRVVAVLIVLTAVSLRTQTPNPTFEVASVRRSPPTDGAFSVTSGAIRGDMWIAEYALLPSLIRYAYAPQYQQPEQLAGGPPWLESDRFHITARINGPRDDARARLMLRVLLAERFALKVHRETRDLPVWDLVLARRDGRLGPRLQRAGAACEVLLAEERRRAGLPQVPLSTFTPQCIGGMTSPWYAEIRSRGMTMGDFAKSLTRATRRTVVDRTGLTGAFTIDVRFTLPQELTASPGTNATALATPSSSWADSPLVGDALREQLGLRLQERRESTEVLVIDSVRPPTAN